MREKWTGGRKRSAGRPKGKFLWIFLVCFSLTAGGGMIGHTGKFFVQKAVPGMLNPVCALAVYAGRNGENPWRTLLRGILSAAEPLFGWMGETAASEASADPVYERYLSSEVLYSGGGKPLLPEGQSGAAAETEPYAGAQQPVSAPVSDPPVSTHLPETAAGTRYTLAQLNDFDYLVSHLYFVHNSTTVYPEQLKAEDLLAKDLTIEQKAGIPQILIHHTHGTEDFSDSGEGGGKTILEVGDYLTELLESYGYTVIHDKSIYPYDTAYSEACARVREILAAYPTIEVIIDLHRDATGTDKRFIAEVDGETVAQLMFFNGMCQTPDGPIDYLDNPYLEDNLAFSLQMKLLAEAYYPGLTRSNFLKAYQYNQHLAPRYTLVEAGTDTNTFGEVCRSMEPLAAILDAVLRDPDAVKLAGSGE